LENAVILISDEENEYNMALRFLCDNFFDIDWSRSNEAIDAGDALYHAAKAFPDVLRHSVQQGNISPAAMMNNRGGLWHPLSGGRPNGR